MNVDFKKLRPNAKIPTYATDGSGCFDIYSAEPALVVGGNKPTTWVNTGIALAVPAGHVLLVFSRSGHAAKYDIRLANCVGVIDSDYRGELRIGLTGEVPIAQQFAEGERIAQGLIVPIPRVEFTEVEELDETARGAGGFGSTGA